MSRTARKNPVGSFEALKEQWSNGKPQPKDLPQTLVASSIKVREEVFQHRRPDRFASDRHVRELADVAKVRDLDRLTVWWDGKKWAVIDGHHRLRAYIRAGKSGHAVPVEVFQGTPEEALGRAAEANTKDKLQMSSSEKSNAAWRLVVMTEGRSKAQQAQDAGVSARLVALMRKTKATLMRGPERVLEDLAEMSWQEARRTAAGESLDWTPEEEEARVEKMTTALRKALGPSADRQPDIFRQALERFSPQLAQALEEAYVEAYREANELDPEEAAEAS